MNATPTPGPLAGLKVIEICTTIAGPACTRLLADFGADVIKIEPPEGDPVRQMGQHVGPVSLYAASILRNKRSIALDLKTPQGRELAAELIAFCRDHLAHLKCPRSIDFSHELPRLPTGKLYKRKLRDVYWAGHTSRIV